MNLKQVIPYNIKKLIPMTLLAIAPAFNACHKEPAPHDVELTFYPNDGTQVTIENLTKLANDPSIRHIYMVPINPNSWEQFKYQNIQFCRNNFLTPRLNISPKIRGRGNFVFYPGEASKIPEDSLWYVQNGWTINKQLENQK